MTDPLVKNPVPPVAPPPHHHFGPHPHPPLPYGGLPPRPWWGHPPSSEMLYHHLGNEGFRVVDYIYEHLGDLEYLIYLLESLQASEQEPVEPVEVEIDLPHKYIFKTSHYVVFKGEDVSAELSDYQKIKLSKDSLLEYEYEPISYCYAQVKVHPKVTVIGNIIYYIFPLVNDVESRSPREIYVSIAKNVDLPGVSEAKRYLYTIGSGMYFEHASDIDWDWVEASNCPVTGEQEFTYGYIGDMVY